MYSNVDCNTIIARTGKQLRCPSTNGYIKKLRYIYAVEYYSAIKRNAFESIPVKWMNLEPFTPSEVSQKGKNKHVYKCIASQKMVLLTLPAVQQRRCRYSQRTYGDSRVGWGMGGEERK